MNVYLEASSFLIDTFKATMFFFNQVHDVVQFYPWYKISFLFFQTHYHVIIKHNITGDKLLLDFGVKFQH